MATTTKSWTPAELQDIAADLESRGPEATLKWMVDNFHPRLYLACSFQQEESVLLDMLAKIQPDARAFYLDTDFLFPETYETRDVFALTWPSIKFERYHNLTPEEQAEQYGEALWESDPNKCCSIRKVEPLKRALGSVDAWITGVRRDQAPTRANAKKVEWDEKFGLVKASPLADWTLDEVWAYISENDVPYNPLHDRNYPSIGCTYCTRPVMPGEDPRAGRWSGNEKTECGLHPSESESK
jgi:phosphoadenosine phosphosulfate reductase